MADQPETTPEQRIGELEKRVAKLKRFWSHLKLAAWILGTAAPFAIGITYVQIRERAVDEAVKRVTPIAAEAAKTAAKVEVDGLIQEETIRQIERYERRAKQAADKAELSSKRIRELELQAEATPWETLKKRVDDLERVKTGYVTIDKIMYMNQEGATLFGNKGVGGKQNPVNFRQPTQHSFDIKGHLPKGHKLLQIKQCAMTGSPAAMRRFGELWLNPPTPDQGSSVGVRMSPAEEGGKPIQADVQVVVVYEYAEEKLLN
jgi:hypothetical protein